MGAGRGRTTVRAACSFCKHQALSSVWATALLVLGGVSTVSTVALLALCNQVLAALLVLYDVSTASFV